MTSPTTALVSWQPQLPTIFSYTVYLNGFVVTMTLALSNSFAVSPNITNTVDIVAVSSVGGSIPSPTVTFYSSFRPYPTPPPPIQTIPVCVEPFVVGKKPVQPFNKREYWGWGASLGRNCVPFK
jgi:hypothetical protein